jgi:hypothetical protein
MNHNGRTDIPSSNVDRGKLSIVEKERVKRGLTVKKLCEQIGLNPATYTSMINLSTQPFEAKHNGVVILRDEWVLVLGFLEIDYADVFDLEECDDQSDYTHDQLREATIGSYTIDPVGIIERRELFTRAFGGIAHDFESLIEKALDRTSNLPRCVRAFLLSTFVGLTLDEIGSFLANHKVCRERARQLVREGLLRIRKRLVHRVIIDYNLEGSDMFHERISRVREEFCSTVSRFPVR